MTPAAICNQRPMPSCMKSIMASLPLLQRVLDDVIEDQRQDQAADDRTPQRVERVFHSDSSSWTRACSNCTAAILVRFPAGSNAGIKSFVLINNNLPNPDGVRAAL